MIFFQDPGNSQKIEDLESRDQLTASNSSANARVAQKYATKGAISAIISPQTRKRSGNLPAKRIMDQNLQNAILAKITALLPKRPNPHDTSRTTDDELKKHLLISSIKTGQNINFGAKIAEDTTTTSAYSSSTVDDTGQETTTESSTTFLSSSSSNPLPSDKEATDELFISDSTVGDETTISSTNLRESTTISLTLTADGNVSTEMQDISVTSSTDYPSTSGFTKQETKSETSFTDRTMSNSVDFSLSTSTFSPTLDNQLNGTVSSNKNNGEYPTSSKLSTIITESLDSNSIPDESSVTNIYNSTITGVDTTPSYSSFNPTSLNQTSSQMITISSSFHSSTTKPLFSTTLPSSDSSSFLSAVNDSSGRTETTFEVDTSTATLFSVSVTPTSSSSINTMISETASEADIPSTLSFSTSSKLASSSSTNSKTDTKIGIEEVTTANIMTELDYEMTKSINTDSTESTTLGPKEGKETSSTSSLESTVNVSNDISESNPSKSSIIYTSVSTKDLEMTTDKHSDLTRENTESSTRPFEENTTVNSSDGQELVQSYYSTTSSDIKTVHSTTVRLSEPTTSTENIIVSSDESITILSSETETPAVTLSPAESDSDLSTAKTLQDFFTERHTATDDLTSASSSLLELTSEITDGATNFITEKEKSNTMSFTLSVLSNNTSPTVTFSSSDSKLIPSANTTTESYSYYTSKDTSITTFSYESSASPVSDSKTLTSTGKTTVISQTENLKINSEALSTEFVSITDSGTSVTFVSELVTATKNTPPSSTEYTQFSTSNASMQQTSEPASLSTILGADATAEEALTDAYSKTTTSKLSSSTKSFDTLNLTTEFQNLETTVNIGASTVAIINNEEENMLDSGTTIRHSTIPSKYDFSDGQTSLSSQLFFSSTSDDAKRNQSTTVGPSESTKNTVYTSMSVDGSTDTTLSDTETPTVIPHHGESSSVLQTTTATHDFTMNSKANADFVEYFTSTASSLLEFTSEVTDITSNFNTDNSEEEVDTISSTLPILSDYTSPTKTFSSDKADLIPSTDGTTESSSSRPSSVTDTDKLLYESTTLPTSGTSEILPSTNENTVSPQADDEKATQEKFTTKWSTTSESEMSATFVSEAAIVSSNKLPSVTEYSTLSTLDSSTHQNSEPTSSRTSPSTDKVTEELITDLNSISITSKPLSSTESFLTSGFTSEFQDSDDEEKILGSEITVKYSPTSSTDYSTSQMPSSSTLYIVDTSETETTLIPSNATHDANLTTKNSEEIFSASTSESISSTQTTTLLPAETPTEFPATSTMKTDNLMSSTSSMLIESTTDLGLSPSTDTKSITTTLALENSTKTPNTISLSSEYPSYSAIGDVDTTQTIETTDEKTISLNHITTSSFSISSTESYTEATKLETSTPIAINISVTEPLYQSKPTGSVMTSDTLIPDEATTSNFRDSSKFSDASAYSNEISTVDPTFTGNDFGSSSSKYESESLNENEGTESGLSVSETDTDEYISTTRAITESELNSKTTGNVLHSSDTSASFTSSTNFDMYTESSVITSKPTSGIDSTTEKLATFTTISTSSISTPEHPSSKTEMTEITESASIIDTVSTHQSTTEDDFVATTLPNNTETSVMETNYLFTDSSSSLNHNEISSESSTSINNFETENTVPTKAFSQSSKTSTVGPTTAAENVDIISNPFQETTVTPGDISSTQIPIVTNNDETNSPFPETTISEYSKTEESTIHKTENISSPTMEVPASSTEDYPTTLAYSHHFTGLSTTIKAENSSFPFTTSEIYSTSNIPTGSTEAVIYLTTTTGFEQPTENINFDSASTSFIPKDATTDYTSEILITSEIFETTILPTRESNTNSDKDPSDPETSSITEPVSVYSRGSTATGYAGSTITSSIISAESSAVSNEILETTTTSTSEHSQNTDRIDSQSMSATSSITISSLDGVTITTTGETSETTTLTDTKTSDFIGFTSTLSSLKGTKSSTETTKKATERSTSLNPITAAKTSNTATVFLTDETSSSVFTETYTTNDVDDVNGSPATSSSGSEIPSTIHFIDSTTNTEVTITPDQVTDNKESSDTTPPPPTSSGSTASKAKDTTETTSEATDISIMEETSFFSSTSSTPKYNTEFTRKPDPTVEDDESTSTGLSTLTLNNIITSDSSQFYGISTTVSTFFNEVSSPKTTGSISTVGESITEDSSIANSKSSSSLTGRTNTYSSSLSTTTEKALLTTVSVATDSNSTSSTDSKHEGQTSSQAESTTTSSSLFPISTMPDEDTTISNESETNTLLTEMVPGVTSQYSSSTFLLSTPSTSDEPSLTTIKPEVSTKFDDLSYFTSTEFVPNSSLSSTLSSLYTDNFLNSTSSQREDNFATSSLSSLSETTAESTTLDSLFDSSKAFDSSTADPLEETILFDLSSQSTEITTSSSLFSETLNFHENNFTTPYYISSMSESITNMTFGGFSDTSISSQISSSKPNHTSIASFVTPSTTPISVSTTKVSSDISETTLLSSTVSDSLSSNDAEHQSSTVSLIYTSKDSTGLSYKTTEENIVQSNSMGSSINDEIFPSSSSLSYTSPRDKTTSETSSTTISSNEISSTNTVTSVITSEPKLIINTTSTFPSSIMHTNSFQATEILKEASETTEDSFRRSTSHISQTTPDYTTTIVSTATNHESTSTETTKSSTDIHLTADTGLNLFSGTETTSFASSTYFESDATTVFSSSFVESTTDFAHSKTGKPTTLDSGVTGTVTTSDIDVFTDTMLPTTMTITTTSNELEPEFLVTDVTEASKTTNFELISESPTQEDETTSASISVTGTSTTLVPTVGNITSSSKFPTSQPTTSALHFSTVQTTTEDAGETNNFTLSSLETDSTVYTVGNALSEKDYTDSEILDEATTINQSLFNFSSSYTTSSTIDMDIDFTSKYFNENITDIATQTNPTIETTTFTPMEELLITSPGFEDATDIAETTEFTLSSTDTISTTSYVSKDPGSSTSVTFSVQTTNYGTHTPESNFLITSEGPSNTNGETKPTPLESSSIETSTYSTVALEQENSTSLSDLNTEASNGVTYGLTDIETNSSSTDPATSSGMDKMTTDLIYSNSFEAESYTQETLQSNETPTESTMSTTTAYIASSTVSDTLTTQDYLTNNSSSSATPTSNETMFSTASSYTDTITTSTATIEEEAGLAEAGVSGTTKDYTDLAPLIVNGTTVDIFSTHKSSTTQETTVVMPTESNIDTTLNSKYISSNLPYNTDVTPFSTAESTDSNSSYETPAIEMSTALDISSSTEFIFSSVSSEKVEVTTFDTLSTGQDFSSPFPMNSDSEMTNMETSTTEMIDNATTESTTDYSDKIILITDSTISDLVSSTRENSPPLGTATEKTTDSDIDTTLSTTYFTTDQSPSADLQQHSTIEPVHNNSPELTVSHRSTSTEFSVSSGTLGFTEISPISSTMLDASSVFPTTLNKNEIMLSTTEIAYTTDELENEINRTQQASTVKYKTSTTTFGESTASLSPEDTTTVIDTDQVTELETDGIDTTLESNGGKGTSTEIMSTTSIQGTTTGPLNSVFSTQSTDKVPNTVVTEETTTPVTEHLYSLVSTTGTHSLDSTSTSPTAKMTTESPIATSTVAGERTPTNSDNIETSMSSSLTSSVTASNEFGNKSSVDATTDEAIGTDSITEKSSTFPYTQKDKTESEYINPTNLPSGNEATHKTTLSSTEAPDTSTTRPSGLGISDTIEGNVTQETLISITSLASTLSNNEVFTTEYLTSQFSQQGIISSTPQIIDENTTVGTQETTLHLSTKALPSTATTVAATDLTTESITETEGVADPITSTNSPEIELEEEKDETLSFSTSSPSSNITPSDPMSGITIPPGIISGGSSDTGIITTAPPIIGDVTEETIIMDSTTPPSINTIGPQDGIVVNPGGSISIPKPVKPIRPKPIRPRPNPSGNSGAAQNPAQASNEFLPIVPNAFITGGNLVDAVPQLVDYPPIGPPSDGVNGGILAPGDTFVPSINFPPIQAGSGITGGILDPSNNPDSLVRNPTAQAQGQNSFFGTLSSLARGTFPGIATAAVLLSAPFAFATGFAPLNRDDNAKPSFDIRKVIKSNKNHLLRTNFKLPIKKNDATKIHKNLKNLFRNKVKDEAPYVHFFPESLVERQPFSLQEEMDYDQNFARIEKATTSQKHESISKSYIGDAMQDVSRGSPEQNIEPDHTTNELKRFRLRDRKKTISKQSDSQPDYRKSRDDGLKESPLDDIHVAHVVIEEYAKAHWAL
ncbi:hypothetical protein QYM36_013995 [Artemia franciscana]|uniref:Uncharacterized protein n=1 Tax=Artemia franciscana TaxID=6661 RepID=A0AA88HFZ7_ARTSF|nr:hypothetical protein QYM36_013995 [Artemia franciscana]